MDNRIQNINIQRVFGARKMNENKTEERIPKNFQDQIDITLEKLVKREREVAEYGDFAPVSEYFDNLGQTTKDIVSKYEVKIYKMPYDVDPDPKKRYVEAVAYEPAEEYKSNMIVGAGTKKEVLELLKDPEFAQKLNIVYGKLVNNLSELKSQQRY